MRVIVVTKSDDVPRAAIDGKPTLVYWNILGLAQAARLSLVEAGVDFVDVRIDAGDPNTAAHKEAWTKAKPGMDDVLAFPNLPYYLDGDGVAVTQSDTILRHIGRKYDLMGPPGQEHLVDQALDELKDVIMQFVRPSYMVGPDAVASWYASSAPGILARWKKLMTAKEYVAGGDRPSVADFRLYTVLYNLTVIQEKLGTPATEAATGLGMEDSWIGTFMRRVEELPKVKDYMATPMYMTRPLNNPSAKFNN